LSDQLISALMQDQTLRYLDETKLHG
jgi:hypothetical protein